MKNLIAVSALIASIALPVTSAKAAILPMFGREANAARLGEGYDATLNSILQSQCIQTFQKDPQPPADDYYKVDGRETVDQSSLDKLYSLDITAQYSGLVSGQAGYALSKAFHRKANERRFDFYAVVDDHQDAMLPVPDMQSRRANEKADCGDSYISRVFYGYLLTIHFDIKTDEQSQSDRLEQFLKINSASGNIGASIKESSEAKEFHETAELQLEGGGSMPTVIDPETNKPFTTSSLSIEKFFSYVENLRKEVRDKHSRPNVVAIETAPYSVALSTSQYLAAADLMRKWRQLETLRVRMNDIVANKGLYLWRPDDGSYWLFHEYIPPYPLNNELVKLGAEQTAINGAIIKCNDEKLVNCQNVEPKGFAIDDYDYIFKLPVLKLKSPTYERIMAAYRAWDHDYQNWISDCYNQGGAQAESTTEWGRNDWCKEHSDWNANGKHYGGPNERDMNSVKFQTAPNQEVALVSLIGTRFETLAKGEIWPKQFSQSQFWWPYYDEAYDQNVLPEAEIHCSLDLNSIKQGCRYANNLVPRFVSWRQKNPLSVQVGQDNK